MKKEDQLALEYRNDQQKFLYYLAAINTASIAYCIDKLIDITELDFTHIILAIAILLFALSVLLTFTFIEKKLNFTFENVIILQAQNQYPYDISKQINKVLKDIENDKKYKNNSKIYKSAFISFYVAVILVFIWVLLSKVF